MSWRWRKAIGAGPLRLNLSRSGVGWSWGIPGLRYGVTLHGRRYISVGFPGLGLYWMKYLDTGRGRADGDPPTVAPPPRATAAARQVWRQPRG